VNQYHLWGIVGAFDGAGVEVVGGLGLGYLFQHPLRGNVHIFTISLLLASPHCWAILEAPSGTSGTQPGEPFDTFETSLSLAFGWTFIPCQARIERGKWSHIGHELIETRHDKMG
jgi:hypothetical protein